MEEVDSPAVRPRRDPLRADCETPVVEGLHGCAQSGLNRVVRWCTLHNCASDIPLAMLDVLVERERPSFCWVTSFLGPAGALLVLRTSSSQHVHASEHLSNGLYTV